jgi:hypothetical protein
MKTTVTLPRLFVGEMLGGMDPQAWEALTMTEKLLTRLEFIEARARTLAALVYDPANGLPANVHAEAARLAQKAESAIAAMLADDAVTAAWLTMDLGMNLERVTTVMAVARALELTPKAQRDDRRQAGTKKERRPGITEWIEQRLAGDSGAKSPQLWADAPEWITDEIGYERFSKRVTKARKKLIGRK